MHAEHGSSGFTIIEILVAVMVLGVGLIALTGSSAAVTRMLGASRRTSFAAQAAERRLEQLRLTARSSASGCLALASGTQAYPQGMVERWEVVPGPGAVLVRVVTTWAVGRGSSTDTVATALECSP
jgi:prepilin-type N-terminal cleavage/methylation domain-containing protein